MPEEPGADLLEVPDSAKVISDSVMGMKSRVGRGGGSSSCKGATWGRSVTKKRCRRASLISDVTWERVEGAMRRGGMRLIERPFLQAAASHKFSEVV